MIKENELRIGNRLLYHINEDGIEWDICTIDWHDLKCISEDHKGFNLVHSPIPLTENHLRTFGAIEHQNYWLLGDLELAWITTDEHFEMEWQTPYQSWKIKPFKFVHELQNFYYCLTGEELKPSIN